MTTTTATPSNIRKAAILIRSLDSESAARLLADLAPGEVEAIRQAIRMLGDVDEEEHADMVAELRRAGSAIAENRHHAVEIDPELFQRAVSAEATANAPTYDPRSIATATPSEPPARFAFLQDAEPTNLAPLLSGEHPQTVAVVLSFLDADRAARLLGALPRSYQTEVLERLAELGDTDPECLLAIEHELAAWVERQPKHIGSRDGKRGDHVARILAAVDPRARAGLIENLSSRNRRLARQLSESLATSVPEPKTDGDDKRLAKAGSRPAHEGPPAPVSPLPPRVEKRPTPTIPFQRLASLDGPILTAIFREVDPHVLQLALAGADEVLVERVARQLPKSVAREFRRSLHQLGPTRLSDVSAAQQMVAETAARVLHQRRRSLVSVS